MEVNNASNESGSTKITNEEMNLVEHEYSLDVPVSQSDVNRWRTLLHSVEPSPNVLISLHSHLAFHTTPNMTTWADSDNTNTREMGGATMSSDYGLKSVEQLCAMQQSQEKTSPTQTIHPLAPLPIFNSNAVINLPMTRLLKLRREWLPHRQQFAAYQQRTQLLEAVLKYSVVAVIGVRGSGKTLQIPSIISETEAFKRRRIIVCCANTTSAQLTALRLRQERGEDVDRAIAAMTSCSSSSSTITDNVNKKKEQSTLTERGGVGKGGTSSVVGLVLPTYSDATEGSSVIVTVADMLLRQLICDPTLSQVGCVIVDDLHLRDEKMEFCLAAVRELVECQEKIISSTTNNTHKETLEKTRLRVILNCVDEHTSSPMLTFFANTRITSLSLHSSSTSSSSSSQPFNVPILYLEETVQWIAKCNSEGSSLCRNPDTELASYADRVDVIGKVMASTEADFNQPQMLQSYWCDIILNALKHFTLANIALRASTVLSYKWIPCAVLVIVPNANAMTIIHNTLKRHLLEVEERNVNSDMRTTTIEINNKNNNYGTDEVHERSRVKPHYVFTMLHDETTSFDTFWRVAQGKECEYQLNQNKNRNNTTVNTMERTLEVHVLFITPQLAQSALPASLSLGLVIDCARSSWCEWDAHGLVDKEMTEFASLQELRSCRNLTQRQILSMTGESHTINTSSSINNTNSKTIMESVTDGLVMFIQLIPKNILHSAQHRRMSTDPTQHRVFHLSLEKYAFMYLYLQLRKHIAIIASSASSVAAGTNSNSTVANSDTIHNSNSNSNSSTSTIPDSIHFLISSMCVAAPASTSHCYDLLKRNMECAEKFLLNSGLLQQSSSLSAALAVRDEINTMTMHVTPLGLLVTALPLPIHVNRLLIFASVCNCVVPALVMAAVWLVGDPFTESYNNLSEQHENEKASRERRALVQEARLFFARESRSDLVSVFNLIKMWLMVRSDHHSNTNAVDHVEGNGNEEESAFLNECGLSKFHLEETLRMTGELYKLMCRYHLIHAVPQNDTNNNNNNTLHDKDALNKFDVRTINQYATLEIAEAIAIVVKGLPEDIAMHGSVQACMTLSLYPHIAIIHQHRLALLLDELHMTSVHNKNNNNNNNTNELMPYNDKIKAEEQNEINTIHQSSRESWRLIKRFGVFETSSVINSSSAANNDSREMNKRLMMYMSALRPLTLSFSSSSSSSLVSELEMDSNNKLTVILSQATPLHLAGAIVSARSIDSHRIRQRTNRCRGWTSLLTLAWRRTSRARLLPPPATQLPQVCIPIQPYDTIHSPQVHLVIDHGLRMTTRESTVQWLRSLQSHIQFHLYTMAMRQTDTEWNEAVESSREIGHAWEWWSRRESNSAAWLREERAVIAAANRKANTHNESEEEELEVEKGKIEISTQKERHLYPYYEFLCVPGLPAKVDAPDFVDHYYYNNNAQEHEQGQGRSEREEQLLLSESDDKKGSSQRNVYTGKRPSPDLDEIIKTCVRNIAANHTREAEAQLLRDNKEIFFFLDPDNEFHEYYLFLLRQAAPEMEVLGDNLEELVEVLQQLEADLRVELGLPAVEAEQIEMHNVADSGQIQHTQQVKIQNEVLVGNKQQNNQKAGESEEEVEEEELVLETEVIDEEYDDDANYNGDDNNESKVQLGDDDARHTYDIEQSGVGVQFENASVNVIRSHGLTDTRHVAGNAITTTTITTSNNNNNSDAVLPLSIATNTQTHEEQQASLANFTLAPTSMVPPDQANNSLHPLSSPFIADATMLQTDASGNNSNNNTVPITSTSGAGQTLMEKLMAMRQGSTTASQTAIIADNNNTKTITTMATNTKMQSQVRHSFDPTSVDVIPEEEEEEEYLYKGKEEKLEIAHSENVHIDQTHENNVPSEETHLLTNNANTQGATFASNGNVSIEPNFVPPTSAELIALLAVPGLPNTSPIPPLPLASSLGDNINNVKVINPLTKPPPPLPSKIIDERAPSVVVYPLPDKKYGNIPLILARALGERLGLRVGPTKIVGNVARIDVPNRKVEARALSLKYFTCVGRKVYLFRNDRIIDNPNPPQRRRKQFMSQKFTSSSTTHGPDQAFSYNNKQNTSLESNSSLLPPPPPPPPLPPSFVQPPPHPSQRHSSLPHYTMNINANNSTQCKNDFTEKEMGETFRHDELNGQGEEDNSHINIDNSNGVNEVHLKIGVFSDSDEEDDEDSSVNSDSSVTSNDDDDNEEEHKVEDVSDNTHNVNTDEENIYKVDKSEQEQVENNNPEMSKLSTSSSEPSPQEEEEKEYEQGLTAEKKAVAEEENEEISMSVS